MVASLAAHGCKAIAVGTSLAERSRTVRAVGLLLALVLLMTPVACRRQAPPAPTAGSAILRTRTPSAAPPLNPLPNRV